MTGKIVSSFPINKNLEDSLRNIFNELKELDLLKEIQIFGGSYVVRKVRGKNKWSVHSYALALDLNPANPSWSKEFVAVWKKYGWSWGGDFADRDDMHFSGSPSEGSKVLEELCKN